MSSLLVQLMLIVIAISAASKTPNLPKVVNIVPPGYPLQLHLTIQHEQSVLHNSSFDFAYLEDQPQLQIPIQILIPEALSSNITLITQLTMELEGKQLHLARQIRNLTRYQAILKKDEDTGLVSYDPMDEINSISHSSPDSKHLEQNQEKQYDIHIPQDFHIMPVISHMPFPAIAPQHKLKTILFNGRLYYLPPLDISQLYIPTKRSKPLLLNGNYTFTLHIFPMSYQKYLMFYTLSHMDQMKADLGVLGQYIDIKEELLDEFKQFFFDNPVWMIALYYLLSIAEVVLKAATIKSQFYFWKNIEQNKGISIKTLFFQLAAEIILGLYLYQNHASKIIIFFHFVDVLVTLWKITRTYSLSFRQRFPYLNLTTSDLYKHRQKIDNQSIWYMNYLLLPLMTGYLAYSLYKKNWMVTSWYSFGLETAVAFIALFGFILMTPQLYLNYKLKSVEHINWRGLTYRFVTTIIDDLFALMVTMPMLRRIMYFRDDVIFVIYIFQRRIYHTDYSRKSVFTQKSPAPDLKNALKQD